MVPLRCESVRELSRFVVSSEGDAQFLYFRIQYRLLQGLLIHKTPTGCVTYCDSLAPQPHDNYMLGVTDAVALVFGNIFDKASKDLEFAAQLSKGYYFPTRRREHLNLDLSSPECENHIASAIRLFAKRNDSDYTPAIDSLRSKARKKPRA